MDLRPNFKFTPVFTLLIIGICSCTSMKEISIQVAIPAKSGISPEIQSIAILNHSMTAEFINLKNDSLEPSLNKSGFRRTFFDSIAADSAIITAAKAIFSSQRFDVVVPVQRNITRDNYGFEPLDSLSIIEICNEFNVDGVLVLEFFSERVNKSITKVLNPPKYFNKVIGNIMGYSSLTFSAKWRFYQPKHDPFISDFDIGQFIHWDAGAYSWSIDECLRKLPSIKEILIEGGRASGFDIADSICPKWIDETRYFYKTGRKDIDAAIPLIKMNKWEEAADIWTKYLTNASPSLRSKIEFNLALASEMTGDLNSAIEWCNKSYQPKNPIKTYHYLKVLNNRRTIWEKDLKNNAATL